MSGGGQAALTGVVQQDGWHYPSKADQAKGASAHLSWQGACATFYVFRDAGKLWWVGAQWSDDQRGWNMRVDPVEKNLATGGGFPAWAGLTEEEARHTCESIDRLLREGVALSTVYHAQPFWGGEERDDQEREEQTRAAAELAAHGWVWPVEPEEEVHAVAALTAAPSWLAATSFGDLEKAKPWRDVGCSRCGAGPGAACRGRFVAGAEQYHVQRARLALEMWRAREDGGAEAEEDLEEDQEQANQEAFEDDEAEAAQCTTEGAAQQVRGDGAAQLGLF